MGLPNRDEMEGKMDRAKGKTKETIGKMVDDRDLESEGNLDQARGDVKEGFGKGRRKIGEAIEDFGEEVGK